MSDEKAFGIFGWYKMLEEEKQKHPKHCPNCGSRRIVGFQEWKW
jgi:DNA-directed RNA polymerase subunit RPC12/RpoP